MSEWRRAALPGVVLGAAIRLTYLATKWSEPLLLNDSLYYSDQAAQLVNGRLFREFLSDQPGAEHGPLTPLLLAPFSWMDNRVAWQRVGTVLFGMAVVVLIARLGWTLGGRRVATIAGVFAAVYPNLWVSDGLVMSESVSVCVVCGLLVVLLPAGRFTMRRSALAGVLVGLGALARSELVLLAPLVAWLIWRDFRGQPRRWLAPLTAVAITGLALLPWAAFNLSRFEDPVLLTTNDGAALLGSYCEPSLRGANTGTWSLFCVLDAPNITPQMDPSQRSTEYRSQAIASARADLGRLPLAAAARLGRMLDVYGYGAQVRQDTGEERPYWVVWAGIACFLALAPLAVRGLWRLPAHERLVLGLPCVVVLCTTMLFYGGHRIRSSMEPTVVLGAAVALASRLGGRSDLQPVDRVEHVGDVVV